MPVVPRGQWHLYPSGSGMQVAPCLHRCGGTCSGPHAETVSVQNAPFHPLGQSQLQYKKRETIQCFPQNKSMFLYHSSQHFQTWSFIANFHVSEEQRTQVSHWSLYSLYFFFIPTSWILLMEISYFLYCSISIRKPQSGWGLFVVGDVQTHKYQKLIIQPKLRTATIYILIR